MAAHRALSWLEAEKMTDKSVEKHTLISKLNDEPTPSVIPEISLPRAIETEWTEADYGC